jgi:hypothetical protein
VWSVFGATLIYAGAQQVARHFGDVEVVWDIVSPQYSHLQYGRELRLFLTRYYVCADNRDNNVGAGRLWDIKNMLLYICIYIYIPFIPYIYNIYI